MIFYYGGFTTGGLNFRGVQKYLIYNGARLVKI